MSPSVKRTTDGPRRGTVLSDGLRAIQKRVARDHGYCLPYVSGPWAGTCPGTTSYGHGFRYTTVHGGSCCERWDELVAEAGAALAAEGEG